MRKNIVTRTTTALFFWMALIAGCGHEKLTGDQIVAKIGAAGYAVEREARIHNTLEGAQDAFWISIDGTRISAYQFSTAAKAQLKARSFQDGVCHGYWAFEFVDTRTAEKLKKALAK
jgi:hypothetical protein